MSLLLQDLIQYITSFVGWVAPAKLTINSG
jgi:hypothetical protein